MAFEKIKRQLITWLDTSPQVKSNPVAILATQAIASNRKEPHPYDQSAHLQVILVNAYIFASIRALARDVSSTPLKVERKRRRNSKWG